MKAQEELYKQFYGYGMSISLRYSYSRDEAVEILNDAYMKVFTNIATYDSKWPFKAWFRTILVRTAIDYQRRNKKHQFGADIDLADNSENSVDSADNLTIENIMELLNKLPAMYRQVFNLYEIDGYSHKEIAVKLDISESASRTTLTRAKKQLRELFYTYFQLDYEELLG